MPEVENWDLLTERLKCIGAISSRLFPECLLDRID